MGLRGKLEAVIYAAEEPVTLAQLAALFGEEALREKEAAGAPAAASTGAEAASAGAEAAGTEEAAVAAQQADTRTEGETEQGGEAQAAEAGRPAEDRARQRAARRRMAELVGELQAEYAAGERGMEIREIAGGYQVATKPEYHDAVRQFAQSLKPPMKLSLQALETLAVIAYKQPVTAPEIAEIRGVDSGGVLGSLMGRKLVTTAGRKQVVGRPILYKTTREFLLRFGLKDLAELPSMVEFERMAGELQSFGQELADAAAQKPGEEHMTETPESETGAAARGEMPAGEPPAGRPSLAPTPILVTREAPEPVEGLAVNKSGAVEGELPPEARLASALEPKAEPQPTLAPGPRAAARVDAGG